MKTLLSCKFNMDTARVELKFTEGSMIAIDTIAVENGMTDNMYQRSEPLSLLRCNKTGSPWEGEPAAFTIWACPAFSGGR